VESTLLSTYNRGDHRQRNVEYTSMIDRARYLKQTGRVEEGRLLQQQAQRLPSYVLDDPDYRRLKYVRYADDFLLGFVGTRQEAETIKQQLQTFLRTSLKLEMSHEKSL